MDKSEFIFTSSERGKVLKFDAVSHECVQDLGKINTYDVSNRKNLNALGGVMPGEIYSICVSNNGQYLATSDNKGVIKLFNPKTGLCITEFDNAHDEESIDVIAFDNQSEMLYSGGACGKLKKWCMKTKKLAEDIQQAHRGATILSMAFTDDIMFTGDGVGVFKAWSLFHTEKNHKVDITDVMKALRSLTCLLDMGPSHPRGIQTMKLSSDNKWLFSADDGGYLKQWNVQEIKSGVASLHHNFGNVMKSSVSQILIDNQNKNLFLPNEVGDVRQFDIEGKKLVKTHKLMDGTYIESGVMNHTGDKIWWTNDQGKMICWDPSTGDVLKDYGKIHDSPIHSIAYLKI